MSRRPVVGVTGRVRSFDIPVREKDVPSHNADARMASILLQLPVEGEHANRARRAESTCAM